MMLILELFPIVETCEKKTLTGEVLPLVVWQKDEFVFRKKNFRLLVRPGNFGF